LNLPINSFSLPASCLSSLALFSIFLLLVEISPAD
jgi:hypothetical protein